MDKKIFELHADMCKVLSNAKRIEIIYLLHEGEKHVDQIADELGTSRANTSQHLSLLREKGLVCTRKEGLNVYFKLCNPKIVKACEIMKEITLESLSEFVNNSQKILDQTKKPS